MENFLTFTDLEGNTHIVNVSAIAHVKTLNYGPSLIGSLVLTNIGTQFAISDPPATFITNTTTALGSTNVKFDAY